MCVCEAMEMGYTSTVGSSGNRFRGRTMPTTFIRRPKGEELGLGSFGSATLLPMTGAVLAV